MESRSDRTAVDISLLVIRLILGLIFMAHGAQKLFGLFGGKGLSDTVQHMGSIGYLVAIGEFFGGLGLFVGFLTRFSAAAIIVIMLGAIVQVHGANGFFAPKGFEYNLSLIALALAVLVAGPGRYTVARPLPFLGRKGEPPHPAIE